MKKIRTAVVGYGNIGVYNVQALEVAKDFEITGIVRRQGDKDKPLELTPYEVVNDIAKLKDVDMTILAAPTRNCLEYAEKISALGINTINSFNIHGSILDYRTKQTENNKRTNTVSVISAGWDPDSDSAVRILLESLAPEGLSYTNFDPGRSMGHSIVIRSKKSVREALSMTIPLGERIRRRVVYVKLEESIKLEDVTKELKADDYFAHGELHVFVVPSVAALNDVGHSVHMTRKGVSGKIHNQHFPFDMSINNPALITQVPVNVARANMRPIPGCYTVPEAPVIDMLPGGRGDIITILV